MADVDDLFADQGGCSARPPMFTPFRLRGLTLPNRVVVSPMDMYSAVDGTPATSISSTSARARWAAPALVFTEMICVSDRAASRPGAPACTATSTGRLEAHRRLRPRVTAVVDRRSARALGAERLYQAHVAGIDEPLEEGNWDVIAPSPMAYSPLNQVPREMTRADMDAVRDRVRRGGAGRCGGGL